MKTKTLDLRLVIVGTLVVAVALAFVPMTFAAAPNWTLNVPSGIDFSCGAGTYSHTLNTVSQDGNGDFTGTGTYDANNGYTWDITGNVSGDDITFTIVYTGIGAPYTLNGVGVIAGDGSIDGTVDNNCQTFSMPAGSAAFVRTAEITSPTAGEEVSGTTSFDATLNDKDGNDSVQWAVREGTCTAGVGTVFGNVDGHSDVYTWDGASFHASADTSSWTPGDYCFIFNPTESAGDASIRETQEFVVKDTTAPILTLVTPEDGETYSGVIDLLATCNETCDYVNFWWRADSESYSNVSPDRRYHYEFTDGTSFTWGLDTMNAEMWGGDGSYVMADGTYYMYAAAKDLAGNWARTPEVSFIVDNSPDDKNVCKKGGWESFLNPVFKNQGQCVSYTESNENAGKRD